MPKCGQKCEVWSRVCGYFRPVNQYNHGKKEEFHDRTVYEQTKIPAEMADKRWKDERTETGKTASAA